MNTERHYFMPWNGEVKIGAPMAIKAKIKEEKGSGPAIKSKLLTSGSSSPRVVESKKESGGGDRIDRLENMVNKLVEGMGNKKVAPKKKITRQALMEHKSLLKKRKDMVTREAMENMTEKQVYSIMERLGTTSPRIKRILYDQAHSKTKTVKPAEVLKEIIKIMGRKKIAMQRRRS